MAALLACACVLACTIYLSRQYVPALEAALTGLAAMSERRFEAVGATGSDEPRALLEALSLTAADLEEQWRILETLGEIDRLLRGPAALEQVLDAMLSRVLSLTRCHCVGITLRERVTSRRGRVYVAATALEGLPVSRVALDDDMLATLAAEPQGLTIARCEDARHSFLKPLAQTGAETFWVWPVIVAGRVEAILAAGFRELPEEGVRLTRCGGEFAARLADALSRSARDERLYRQAHFDTLTELPNRLLFRDRLEQEIAAAAASGSGGALLYIDLDHFKRVNDGFGHGVGDQLLAVVAQRLKACVKDGDLVARLGGDEFSIVLRDVSDAAAARRVAERVAETLQLPARIGDGDHRISASIGVTLFPDDGATLEDLVRNADTAMYRAKDLGRGRFMLFEAEGAAARPSSLSGAGLQRALRRREFTLFYQPQFAVADGALTGLEALMRWHIPREGICAPEEFVPAAEESGLIVDIGGWVLEAACAQLASWRDSGMALPRLSVNVCAQQLKDPDFPRSVRRAIDKHGLAPSLIELELAPSLLADEESAAALERLVPLGIRLALEDFGAGYSAAVVLSGLRRYPIESVKIDRALMSRVPQDGTSAALVKTGIETAHTLGKRVVAQGIERIEQLDFLREHRCDQAQGFYLARPLSAAAVTELLGARAALEPGGAVAREAS
ncbi:MAG: putative bifunctional diguanylate cyclase/phosphodiesterase [Steroidobacteraceae bacterium]